MVLANDILLYVSAYHDLALSLQQLLGHAPGHHVCVLSIGRNLGKENEELFLGELGGLGLQHELVGRRIYKISA